MLLGPPFSLASLGGVRRSLASFYGTPGRRTFELCAPGGYVVSSFSTLSLGNGPVRKVRSLLRAMAATPCTRTERTTRTARAPVR
jgi:hypothetical protein